MSAGKSVPHIHGWVKLAAALILLTGLLLGGILAAPGVSRVQALNPLPQITAPRSLTSSGVNGTLASFTALIPQIYAINLPFVAR